MEQDGGGEPLARRWASRLERWIARAAGAQGEDETPKVEGREPVARLRERAPTSHGTAKRACARCGRSLRWALPLCWDCDAAAKKAGAAER
jgi:hypothetical protein